MIVYLNLQVEYRRHLFKLCDKGGEVGKLSHLLNNPGVDPNIFDEVIVENTSLGPVQTKPNHMHYSLEIQSADNDWNMLVMECSSLASKWRMVSTYLGLPKNMIDQIETDHSNSVDKCSSYQRT